MGNRRFRPEADMPSSAPGPECGGFGSLTMPGHVLYKSDSSRAIRFEMSGRDQIDVIRIIAISAFPVPRCTAQIDLAIPHSLDGELRDEISRQLSFVGAITLLDRLKALYRIYPQSLRQLFPAGDTDLTLLKNVRNFLTHYGTQKKFDRDFLFSRRLYVLSEKARLFVEICLLGILGLNDKEIVELLGQFEPYTWALEKH